MPEDTRTPVSLAQVRRDVMEQARTISVLVANDARRTEQEKSREELNDLKEEHLNERLKRIEDKISAVYSLGKWLLVSAGSTLLLAVITFILRGGLFV